jgi:hypothetical protein
MERRAERHANYPGLGLEGALTERSIGDFLENPNRTDCLGRGPRSPERDALHKLCSAVHAFFHANHHLSAPSQSLWVDMVRSS